MIKFLIFIFLIVLDFLSKKWISNSIDLNHFVAITFFLDIAHIHNFGISFGLFAEILHVNIIILLAGLVTIFIFYLFLQSNNALERWGLLFIISGAISNISDRILNSYVVDFIYLYYNNFYWPAFNFADIYITIGIMIVLVCMLRKTI